MELYCQKCLKQLELDESLLDIDQSLLLNSDKDDILPLVKELQQLSLKLPTQSNNSNNGSSLHTLSSKYIEQPIGNSNSTGNLASSVAQPPPPLSKFKSGFFNRNRRDISQSVPSTPILPISPPPIQNSSSSILVGNEGGGTQPIGTTSFNTPISSSPPIQLFGSLSQHRLNSSLVSPSNHSTSGNSKVIISSSISSSSSSSNSSNGSTHSEPNENIKNNSNSIKINLNSNSTNSNLSKTYSPSTILPQNNSNNTNNSSHNHNESLKLKRSTMNLNRSSKTLLHQVVNNNNNNSNNQSTNSNIPNVKSSPSKQRLKYLRSSSKSLSLASLPAISPPNTNSNSNNSLTNNSQNSNTSSIINTPNISSTENLIEQNKISPPQPQIQAQSQQTQSTQLQQPQLQSTQSQFNLQSNSNSNSNNNNNNNNNQQIQQNNPINTKKFIQSLSLFKITTELIKYDLPLCLECTKIAITELEEENENLNVDHEVYMKYLRELDFKEREYQVRMNTIDKEIEKLEEDECYLKKFLEDYDKEGEKLNILEFELVNREKVLDSFELQYWTSYHELHYNAYSTQDDHDSIQVETKWVNEQLEQLKQTSILNDAFHLWYDGHFGTINSLRLGKLPSQPVDWNEINAAWGLAISLLDNMAKRLKFKFSSFILVPNGSCSRIEKKDDPSSHSYELFGSNDISLGRLFWYRRFDNGMVAFLHCIKELCDFIRIQDKDFYVPYPIEKENIGGYQIKMQFSSDDVWTKSLKFMLTNLKYLLIWVTKYESTQPISITGSNNKTNSSAINGSGDLKQPTQLNKK